MCLYRDQTYTGWSPDGPAFEVCSRSMSKSKVWNCEDTVVSFVLNLLNPGRFQTAVRASHYRGRASPKCLATGIAVWPAILVRIGRYNIDAKRATLPTSLPVSFTEDLVSFKRCTLLLYVHSLILASKPSRLPACFLTNRLEFWREIFTLFYRCIKMPSGIWLYLQ